MASPSVAQMLRKQSHGCEIHVVLWAWTSASSWTRMPLLEALPPSSTLSSLSSSPSLPPRVSAGTSTASRAKRVAFAALGLGGWISFFGLADCCGGDCCCFGTASAPPLAFASGGYCCCFGVAAAPPFAFAGGIVKACCLGMELEGFGFDDLVVEPDALPPGGSLPAAGSLAPAGGIFGRNEKATRRPTSSQCDDGESLRRRKLRV